MSKLYIFISGSVYFLTVLSPLLSRPVSVRMLLRAGLLTVLPGLLAATSLRSTECRGGEGSLHDHSLQLLDGSRNVSLAEFAGKVVVLVNVATY